MTPSEMFVADLCTRSFMAPWVHPSPKGRSGNELCDCLMVCGPHVVIISVKDIKYRATGDGVGAKRWHREAVEKSAKQIKGAERFLDRVNTVERLDGRLVSLPPVGERRYHRIAVAMGGRGKVPMAWGDLGHGFVHVCDEWSTGVVLGLLNTITDLVRFLTQIESLVEQGAWFLMHGAGIEDLAAVYLQNDFSLPGFREGDRLPSLWVLEPGLFEAWQESEGYRQLALDVERSFFWDHLIDDLAKDLLSGGMFDLHSGDVTESDLALAEMAQEPRLVRTQLAPAAFEFLSREDAKDGHARTLLGREGRAYVLLLGSSEDRQARSVELAARCLIVRARVPLVHTVVGLATDRPGSSTIGYSTDIVAMHYPDWSEGLEQAANEAISTFGYFSRIEWPRAEEVRQKWSYWK